MKKILLVGLAVIGFAFAANAQQDKARVPGDYDNMVFASVSDDSQTSSSITFYNNSTKSIEVCVSVYNDQGCEVGKGCYYVSGAAEQGKHSESTATLSKNRACSSCTSGCEAKRIKITSVKVQN
jgi:hypothetical protein